MKNQPRETLQLINEKLKKLLKKKSASLKLMRRDLKIEASLERVRTVAMSMSKPEELISICESIYRELIVLGFSNIRNAQIALKNEARQSYLVSEFSDYNVTFMKEAPFGSSPIVRELFDEMGDSEDALYQRKFSGKEFDLWRTWRSGISNSADNRVAKTDSMYFYLYSIGLGHLGISTFKEITKAQLGILKRFKKVFELSYKRYADVTKAEAHAREAQIELGLERVRARAMAMQKSEDLGNAIEIVFEELDKLNLGIIRCGIGIIDKDKRSADVWTTTKSDNNKVVQVSGDESMDIHPLLKGVYNAWLKQEDFNYVLKGGDLNDYYKALTGVNFRLPESQSLISGNEEIQQYHFNAIFPAGGLFAFSESAFSDEAKNVLKHFANVFNLTYTRFNDLKLAEYQAGQARLDLIKLQIEKKRTEEAFSELKATQSKLIQSEKMASLGELTAGIAHEIQNPLNFVNNFSEVNTELIDEMNTAVEKGDMVEVKAIASDIRGNLEKISHHGKRADAIVKSMLQHSRTSSGVNEQTDINKLADEYLRLAYHGLRAKDMTFNATMKTDYDGTIGNIPVISQDIGRVILNLITNAFYTVTEKRKLQLEGYEPTVSLSTKKIDGKVEIKVKDNGMGIPGIFLHKIFQPFFTTKPTGQGTGLGLSLSYDIIKAHGGEIKVETREGNFTEFTIQLPDTYI
jgi:signal transduction histidine kinase